MPLIPENAIKTALSELAADPRIPPDSSTPRGQIFIAATRLFAEHGFLGTNTRAIAQEAGVKQVMIHYYFGSKEQLYEAVLKYEGVNMLAVIFETTVNVKTHAELLAESPIRLMNVLRKNPQWASLMRREIADGAVRLRRALKGIAEIGPLGAGTHFSDTYREAVKAGKAIDLPVEAVRVCLLAIGYSAIYLAPLMLMINETDVYDEKIWNELTTTLSKILSRGLLIDPKE